jgi:hypothetical protein
MTKPLLIAKYFARCERYDGDTAFLLRLTIYSVAGSMGFGKRKRKRVGSGLVDGGMRIAAAKTAKHVGQSYETFDINWP